MIQTSSAPPLVAAIALVASSVSVFATAGWREDPTPAPSPTVTSTSPSPAPTRSAIVITDENLKDYADQGRLTTAEPGNTTGAGTGGRPVHAGSDSGLPPVQVPADDSEAEKKRYWRELYQRQVDIIQQLRGEIEILDTAIPGLWNKFYAWDDPAYRDSVIKPELDQALVRREHLEKQLVEERARLPKIMDEARRDGASPGWFRDLPRPTDVLSTADSSSK